jgi:3-phenylpropionate/trans-cinnamate dioxygenase ferredoxin component
VTQTGDYIAAAKVREVGEGSILPVDVKGTHILLSRFGTEVSAVGGVCTHEETDLGLGFVIEDRVVCPLHLSQFDLKTGQVMNPPATVPLKVFNVKIDGETILVEV